MNKLTIAAALAACVLAGNTYAAPQADEPEEAAHSRKADRNKDDDRVCVQQTGTRITSARAARTRGDERDCVGAGGRVYSREDIEATGSPDLRDALRRLDPAIN